MSSYKKIKSTIMVPEDTYKETRILAIRRGMDIGSLVDEALREKIVRDYQQMGLQPPFPQTQPQPQPPLQHNDPVVHSSRYEAAKTKTKSREPPEEEILKEAEEISEELEHDYQLTIPDLNFPIDKKGLLQIMREVQNEFNKKYNKVPLEVENALFLIEKLEPNKMYKGSLGLKDDLDILVSDKKIVEKLIGIPERLPGCSVVHTDPISEWDDERWERGIREDYEVRRQYQERKQQYKPQKGSLEYSLVLSELKFPMTKNEIIERAKKVKYPDDDQETQETMKITIDILNQLPDDIYSKNKLERDFSNILMRKLKNLRGYEGRVITIVYDEQSPPEQGPGEKQPSAAQLTK